jgi:hypothetical protein
LTDPNLGDCMIKVWQAGAMFLNSVEWCMMSARMKSAARRRINDGMTVDSVLRVPSNEISNIINKVTKV